MALEYNVRTGKLVVRRSLETIAVVGLGYAGATAGLNNPEMEHVRNVGPIPEGAYFLRETRHPRFRAPAFECVPTFPTSEKLKRYGRGGFWIHGDNASLNFSASSGCIILSRDARFEVQKWLKRGHTILTVVA